MFKITIESPNGKYTEEVKVYYRKNKNSLKLVYENKGEYNIDCLYHSDKECRLIYARDAAINHFVNSGINVVSI